jgi:hypothetical protein
LEKKQQKTLVTSARAVGVAIGFENVDAKPVSDDGKDDEHQPVG